MQPAWSLSRPREYIGSGILSSERFSSAGSGADFRAPPIDSFLEDASDSAWSLPSGVEHVISAKTRKTPEDLKADAACAGMLQRRLP